MTELDSTTPLAVAAPPGDTLAPKRGPGRLEAAVFSAGLLLVSILISAFTRGYGAAVAVNGDNQAYAGVAAAILHWNLQSLESVKHFWGLPYLAAAFSYVFRTSELHSLAIVSALSVVASAALTASLWPGWIAVYFVATSYTLIQFGAFGGADPLFLLLLLASFYFSRQNRWIPAVFFGSLATTVRPLGLLGLAGLAPRIRRDFKTMIVAALIVAGVLVLYALPLVIYFGNPFINWQTYQRQDWDGRSPVTFPLIAVMENLGNRANLGNPVMILVKLVYIGLHLAALAGICFSRRRRDFLFSRPAEGLTVLIYSAFLLTYNAPSWAVSIYPRMLIPITPMLLYAYSDLLPKNRGVVVVLGFCSAVVAFGSSLGWAGLRGLL